MFSTTAFTQSRPKDVVALEKKADALFREGQYTLAKDVYSTLLSNYSKDPFYSYRFGVCLLYGDRRDMEKPVPFLELASKSPKIEEEVFYYLGKSYHFNYRFADAIRMYEKYISIASKGKVEDLDVEREIEMCRNGMYLLSRVKDLFVIDKKVVRQSDFHRSYDLGAYGGELLQKPPVFQSRQDKKKKHSGLVYFPEKQDVVFFSSHGEDGKNKLDIYKSYLLPDQTWSKPERLMGLVNTPYDEDHPFLLPDGRTLYFCSKGHSSMGGYDVFRSLLDTTTGIWQEPENMDFAINTPFNDILFVTDPGQKYAFFASDRATVEGNTTVYLVRVDSRPDKILDVDLQKPLVGVGKESEYLRQSITLIKQMADLAVNADKDFFKDIPASVRIDDQKASAPPADSGKDVFSFTVDRKVKEKASGQQRVDSVFWLLDKMEKSGQALALLNTGIQNFARQSGDAAEKSLAGKLSLALEKEISKKQSRLNGQRLLSGRIQQMAATGQTDSLSYFYEQFRQGILPSDTATDFQQALGNLADNRPAFPLGTSGIDPFMADFKEVKTENDKETLAVILTQAASAEMAMDTGDKTIAKHVPDVVPPPDKQDTVIQKPFISEPKPEEINRIVNQIRVMKDSLLSLKTQSERQKLLLLEQSLAASNEAGTKQEEMKRLTEVLGGVITKGSARDLKNTIQLLAQEASAKSKEAVLAYALAVKMGEREKVIQQALKELENQSVIISKTIDSGRIEKAAILLEVVLRPLRKFQSISYANDDIITSVHRHARELKVNVLANLKSVRTLAISAKSMADLAENLKGQASKSQDPKEAKSLLRQAADVDRMAAAKQKEAVEGFNQNMIWHNRSQALEASLSSARDIMTGIAGKSGEHYVAPRKRIKDTTLLIPVILDLLSSSLPYADSTYNKLIEFEYNKLRPMPLVNSEIIRRTENVAGIDEELIAEQSKRAAEKPDLLVFPKIDPREIALRERLAILADSVERVSRQPRKPDQALVIRQWEEDRESFDMLKSQIDTLYARLKRNPGLKVSTPVRDMLLQLSSIIDSMDMSFNQYKEAKLGTGQGPESEKLAMIIALEGFEVKASMNRLKYLINKLTINDIEGVSEEHIAGGKTVRAFALPDSMVQRAERLRASGNANPDLAARKAILENADQMERRANEDLIRIIDSLRTAPRQPIEPVVAKTGSNTRPVVEPKAPALEAPEKKEVVTSGEPKPPVPSVPESRQGEKGLETRRQEEQRLATQKIDIQKIDYKTAKAADTFPSAGVSPIEKPVAIPSPPEAMPARKIISPLLGKSIIGLTKDEKNLLERDIAQAVSQSQLAALPGLYYSVQVGVYRSTRNSAQLFNIHPLFEDRTNNGLYRYFSGIYGRREDAVTAKNGIVERGVPDAFVVVFYQGRKISLAEAANLAEQNVNVAVPQATIEQIVTRESKVSAPVVYFSVQLVAYRRPVKDSERQLFREKTNREVASHQTGNGLHVLVSGRLASYEESLALRLEIIDSGVTDAFIVGFIDGERVMAYQAREALSRQR